MSLFVDASVWIDYFNGKIMPETDFLHDSLGKKEIIIGTITLTEVLQGFRHDKEFRAAKSALQTFTIVPMVDEATAMQTAENYRLLRKQGITIRKTIDCLIATLCIEQNYTLLHNDRDFLPFADLLGLKTWMPATE